MITPQMNYSKDVEDHFETPEYAVVPLIQYLKPESVVWECTDTRGTSGITSALRKYGHKVIDNIDRVVDYNNDEQSEEFMCSIDYIITNPPYNNKDEFIEDTAYYASKYPHIGFALLMPVTALSSIRRCKVWSSIDLEVLVLDRRVEFTGGSGTWFATMWFCYRVLPKQIIIHQLPKYIS